MSVRITQGMQVSTMLSDLQSIADRLSATQEKLSSGKELTKPSDDPFGVSRALQFRSDLSANQQYQRNVTDASAWHEVTDTALSHISDYVLRARDLVVQGANDTLGSQARQAIAEEVGQLIDSIKTEANAQYAGRYVFSGTDTQTAPYSMTDTTDTFNGNSNDVTREIGPGVGMAINSKALTVIGGTDPSTGTASGLLKTLRDVYSDLASGNVAALGGADLKNLDAGHDTLLDERAQVGARMNRLDTASSRLSQVEETTTSLLSQTEDADMAKTYVDFSTQQAVYQAALKATASVIQPSLLDFLR